ncbi:DNA-binding protein [Streptomyces sp. MMG1533]|uniref:BRO-N domain-containing protein n=1 Tax=Streptomyces sp. MMG1533 TaxID=1415546 RepID=UPI0006AE280E|nr:Bro-N domain-containing protein [Streptomyces sp. MMG1533]KOU63762.1 DNA-binding protein [Streptomyces sp. MMG1533]
MYEQNNTGQRQDAVDISDFVFAATGARVRRLTTPEGEHWFPAADVARNLGYANTRQALQMHVPAACHKRLSEFAQGVCTADTLSKLAAHRLQKSMKMVNLQGLLRLVHGCTKPECEPFKDWVSKVVTTIQRDGSYSLEPSPAQTPATGAPAYVMPQVVADAIVRLEVRNIQADEMLAAFQEEQTVLLRKISRNQSMIADALQDIAQTLRLRHPEPKLTPQQLLATWNAKNLVFTEDIHAVAAYLAPALVRGAASYRMEEIATRTGLSLARVHDCLRTLLKRGCMRQTGCAPDGAPVYVLP